MIQPDFAQDPDELFDVVNEDGSATGIVKRRADVHRDGDWHRAVHVWVYGVDENGPFILYNLRSRMKDTMPGRLDVTVGGHLGAGEAVRDALRETDEEIGIVVDPVNLTFLHVRKAYGETERELQDVYLLRDDRPLTTYRPNPAELEALVKLSLADAIAVFSGTQATVGAIALVARSATIEPFTVDEMSLLPSRYFPYYLDIAQTVLDRLDGEATPLA